jgi:hypothetical protein
MLGPGTYRLRWVPRNLAYGSDTNTEYFALNNLILNPSADQNVTVPHDGDPSTNTAAVTLDGSASFDPDGDLLTYVWKDQNNLTVANTAVANLNLTAGDYTFTLTVTDPDGQSDSKSVHVTVAPEPNAAPSLTVPASAQVDVGCPVTFQASATDPDNDGLTYSLVNPPSWASIDSSTGLVTLAPLAGTSGNFTLTVKATDPYGASDSKNVSVTVCPIIIEAVTVTRQNKIVTVQFNLRNTDGTTVSNVSLNSSTLKGINTMTAMPIVYAQMKGGVVKMVQLKFQNVPSGGPATFIVNGTSSAGPVCTTMTVNVP